MKSRLNVISAAISVIVLFLILADWKGFETVWRACGVNPMQLPFADTRVITHGAESYAHGLDPMVENPGDPWRRKMNYPRIWQALYPLGLNRTHTIALAVAIIASFWIGVCLLLPHATNQTLAIVLVVAVSPAALLGMERGNIDLFIFFLTALAVWAMQKSVRLACGTLLASFILKLFPLCSWVLLLRLEPPRFKRAALIMSGLGGLYLLVTFSDILRVIEGTPKAAFWSYGMNVCWMSIGELHPGWGANLQIVSWILVVLFLAWAGSALLRENPATDKNTDPLKLDGFRAGAGVYVGTFLIGNNWDYRLIFLILVLPLVLVWAKETGQRCWIARVTLSAILISCWHLLLMRWVFGYEEGYQAGFLLDELANWTVFAGLAYLLADSVPAWIKETIRQRLPNKTGAAGARASGPQQQP